MLWTERSRKHSRSLTGRLPRLPSVASTLVSSQSTDKRRFSLIAGIVLALISISVVPAYAVTTETAVDPHTTPFSAAKKGRHPYRKGQRFCRSGRRYPPRVIPRRDGDIPGQVGHDQHWNRRNRYGVDDSGRRGVRRGGSRLHAARKHGARRLYHRSFLQRWRWGLPRQHGDQRPDGYRSDCDTDEHGDLDAHQHSYSDSDTHFDGDLNPDQHSYFDADRDRHTNQYSDGFTDRYRYIHGDRDGHQYARPIPQRPPALRQRQIRVRRPRSAPVPRPRLRPARPRPLLLPVPVLAISPSPSSRTGRSLNRCVRAATSSTACVSQTHRSREAP